MAVADFKTPSYATAIPQVKARKSAVPQVKLEVCNCGLADLPSTGIRIHANQRSTLELRSRLSLNAGHAALNQHRAIAALNIMLAIKQAEML